MPTLTAGPPGYFKSLATVYGRMRGFMQAYQWESSNSSSCTSDCANDLVDRIAFLAFHNQAHSLSTRVVLNSSFVAASLTLAVPASESTKSD